MTKKWTNGMREFEISTNEKREFDLEMNWEDEVDEQEDGDTLVMNGLSDEENWDDVQAPDEAQDIWESVGEGSAENDQETKENEGEIRVLDEDWDALNAALNEQERTTKKTKVKRLNKQEKAERLTERKAHLILLLAREAQVNRVLMDVTLQALLRSLVPMELEQLHHERHDDFLFFLQHLINWFRLTFRKRPYSSATSFEISVQSLMQVYFQREGHEHELVGLFVLLCRSWGLSTRYTCSLDTSSSLKRHATFVPFFGIDESPPEAESAASLRNSLRAWCQVYSEQGWVHVDVVRNLVNQPKQIEKLRGRGNLLPHVVSFDVHGNMIDVSREYANDWARTQLHRVHEVWWSKVLEEGKTKETAVDVDAKLPLPTSAEGFRNHRQYCLEQQLGLYEFIHPRKPVGLFKGVPVFDRQAVHTLHSAHRWLRQGRVVRESELSTPCKSVPRRKSKQNPTQQFMNPQARFSEVTAVQSEQDKVLALYGLWQTDPYVAPAIIDGKIPKNEHGNIEIWSEAFLPLGSRHIRLARAKQVATQLGVDFAPAVVGWESRNGRSVPVFDGIVVCEEDVELIDEAHLALEQSLVQNAIARKQKQVAKRWAIFAKKLLLRKRLRDEYG